MASLQVNFHFSIRQPRNSFPLFPTCMSSESIPLISTNGKKTMPIGLLFTGNGNIVLLETMVGVENLPLEIILFSLPTAGDNSDVAELPGICRDEFYLTDPVCFIQSWTSTTSWRRQLLIKNINHFILIRKRIYKWAEQMIHRGNGKFALLLLS